MKRQTLLKTTVIISIISLIIVIFLSSFAQMAFNKSFYLGLQKKHGVYDQIGKNTTINMTYNVIGFLQGKNDLNYFTENERTHMLDVKDLFNNIFGVFYPALFIFLLTFVMIIYLDKHNSLHNISRVFAYSGSISLVLVIILWIMSSNFYSFFMSFHKVFFSQGNYLFPEGSLLPTLFPDGFFRDFGIRIFSYSAVKAAILLGVGLIPPSGFSKKKKLNKT